MSESNSIYPYITADNRANPQAYMYSAYHGQAFLREYFAIRESMMQRLIAVDPPAAGPVTDSMVIQELERLARTSPLPFVQTAIDLFMPDRLDRIVHSFEIHKKVFGEYDAGGRPVDRTDYRSTTPYVVLSAALGLAISQNLRLKHLNSLIKLLDTISSFAHELIGAEVTLVRFALQAELQAVRDLMEQKGVSS